MPNIETFGLSQFEINKIFNLFKDEPYAGDTVITVHPQLFWVEIYGWGLPVDKKNELISVVSSLFEHQIICYEMDVRLMYTEVFCVKDKKHQPFLRLVVTSKVAQEEDILYLAKQLEVLGIDIECSIHPSILLVNDCQKNTIVIMGKLQSLCIVGIEHKQLFDFYPAKPNSKKYRPDCDGHHFRHGVESGCSCGDFKKSGKGRFA